MKRMEVNWVKRIYLEIAAFLWMADNKIINFLCGMCEMYTLSV